MKRKKSIRETDECEMIVNYCMNEEGKKNSLFRQIHCFYLNVCYKKKKKRGKNMLKKLIKSILISDFK